MVEIFKAIFDANKIPTKIFFVVFVVGSFLFYAPSKIIPINFKEGSDLKIYAYIIYLICSGIFIVNLITAIYNFFKNFFFSIQIKKEYKVIINNLDNHEKAVLREFYLYNKNTLDFPYDNSIVAGLVDKKVLFYVSQFGGGFIINGRKATFKMNNYIKKNINPIKDLDLPNDNNKEEAQNILDKRPEWTNKDLYIKDDL
jgi:hypothetical protein